MAFCVSCGQQAPEAANFCPACGHRSAAPEVLPSMAPPPIEIPTEALAPFGRRIGAWGINAVIVYGVLLLGPSQVIVTTTPEPTYLDPSPDAPALAVLLMAAAVLAAGAYYVFFEGTEAGQTPGMKVLGLRVVRDRDGRPLGFRKSVIRLLGVITNLCGIGLLVALKDKRRRTLRDQVSGTVVVRASAYPLRDWPRATIVDGGRVPGSGRRGGPSR